MKVLVTGASGLIGSAVCKLLLERKCFVTGIVNRSSSGIKHENYSDIVIDLTKHSLETNIKDFDAIIHCAAVTPKKSDAKQSQFNFLNEIIDENIFSFSSKRNVRIIYLSAAYLYKNTFDSKVYEFSDLRSDLEGYYYAKKKSEDSLLISQLDSLIFRISSPYGNIEKQSNVMQFFTSIIKENLPITLINNGERLQNFIHVEDIALACYMALTQKIKGIYNLTYKSSYSMLQLASYIKEIYKSKSEFLFDRNRTDDFYNVNFDNSKLKEALQWEPFYDLKAGLIKTLLQ